MAVYSCLMSNFKTSDKQKAIAKTKYFIAQLKAGTADVVYHTVEWIAEKMAEGYSFNFSETEDRQLFMVDIDNKVPVPVGIAAIMDFLKDKGILPVAVGESLSSSIKRPKYHVLFALDIAVEDFYEYKAVVRYVVELLNDRFSGIADLSSYSKGRIFYPSSKIVYCNSLNVLRFEDLKRNYLLRIIDKKLISRPNFLAFYEELAKYCYVIDNKLRHPDLFDILPKLPLNKLFDTTSDTETIDMFRSDENNSATFIAKNGHYYYQRTSNGKIIAQYDIYKLFMTIFDTENITRIYHILCYLIGVKAGPLSSAEVVEQLEMLKQIAEKSTKYFYLHCMMSRNDNGLYELYYKILCRVGEIALNTELRKTWNQLWITKESLDYSSNGFYRKINMLNALGLIEVVASEKYSPAINLALAKRCHKQNNAIIITFPIITEYTLEKINSRAKFLAESHITEANIDYAANEHKELYKIATILTLKKDAFKLKYILLNDFSNELSELLPGSNKSRLSKLRTLMPKITELTGFILTTVTKDMINDYEIKEHVYPNVTKIILLERKDREH